MLGDGARADRLLRGLRGRDGARRRALGSGQWDAARALGLPRAVTLRLVVLPQALRIMVPPMANTYSGIVKASSLGVAIGYQELVSVTNSMLSSTGQAIELVLIVMAVYFAINAAIGLAAGWFNTRLLRIDR